MSKRIQIPSASDVREEISALLAANRYDAEDLPRDESGMPKIKSEPQDPDDE